MAGNGQNKEQPRGERVAPGTEAGKSSRVSRAAGSIGSSSVRMESRPPASNSRSRGSGAGSNNAEGRAGSQRASAGSKAVAGRKNGSASQANRKGAANASAPADS